MPPETTTTLLGSDPVMFSRSYTNNGLSPLAVIALVAIVVVGMLAMYWFASRRHAMV